MTGGVLPEIQRVWIAIDNVLYLWNYNDQSYEIYDALDVDITCVALVKPRPGKHTVGSWFCDWLPRCVPRPHRLAVGGHHSCRSCGAGGDVGESR